MDGLADGVMRAVASIERLDFGYGNAPSSALLFDRFSADFQPGVTWVKGSNGCGKSTLLKLLAGVLPPSQGHITLKGIRQDLDPMGYRQRMFWCGPGALAFDHLKPLEYLGFIRGLYPSFNADAVAGHLEGFALHPHLRLPLRDLSTGTQRKVWLVAALCANTPVTLLDEPLNALDTASLSYLGTALANVTQQADRAWIVVSHEAFGVVSEGANILTLGMPP